jgi:hypothetical protein
VQLVSSTMSAQMSSLVPFISPCPWLTLVVRWSFEKSNPAICFAPERFNPLHFFQVPIQHLQTVEGKFKGCRQTLWLNSHTAIWYCIICTLCIDICLISSQSIVRIQVQVTEAEMEPLSNGQSCVWLRTSQDVSPSFACLCRCSDHFRIPQVTVVGSWVIVTMSEKRLRMRCSISSSRETSVQH